MNFNARLARLESLPAFSGPEGEPVDLESFFRKISDRLTPAQRTAGREALARRFDSWDAAFSWLKGHLGDELPYDPADPRDWLPGSMSASCCFAAGLFPDGGETGEVADEPV